MDKKKVLAIETSSKIFNIALAEANAMKEESSFTLKANLVLDIGFRHSEILKDVCVFLLNKCGWEKNELSLLAVCTGPGSFTGLRVGISFARALAQTLQVPLLGVPAFEILATAMQKTLQFDPLLNPVLCILIDSIGNEVYSGFFQLSSRQTAGQMTSHLRLIEPYKIYSISNLSKKIQSLKYSSNIVFAGEGFLRYKQEIRRELNQKIIDLSECHKFPEAKMLAELALSKIKKRKTPSRNSWQKVAPFYVRPPLAVERLRKSL